jgi:hypothetical protein
MAAAITLDHFGVFGLARRIHQPVTPLGAALLIAGVVLTQGLTWLRAGRGGRLEAEIGDRSSAALVLIT